MNTGKASRIGAALGLLLALPTAWAAPDIYTCTDASGKKLTSDRPIQACIDREQRVLGSDGSVRRIISRTLTAEERAEKEASDREAASQSLTRQDAIRRDRNLMIRFPNEAAHKKAREAALNDVRNAMQTSDNRLAALASERKPLMDETEFYVGKPLPPKLKRQLDANDASTEAQRTLIQDQRSELERINALYDVELERLKLLWGGAQPGSVGAPVPSTAAAPPPRKAAVAK
jgi:hypothetical protein